MNVPGKNVEYGLGEQNGFPHIRRQQCHCCDCSKVCSSLFGLCQAGTCTAALEKVLFPFLLEGCVLFQSGG